MASTSTRDVSPASEDEEDFVDASEEQTPTDDEMQVDDDGASSVTEMEYISKEHRGEDMDEEDLFDSVFGPQQSAEDSDDEAAPPPKKSFSADEHTKGCTSVRGSPTPPRVKAKPSSVIASSQPTDSSDNHAPHPIKDRSGALRHLQRFHNRAKELVPRLPLQPHRYWIGVLSTDRSPETAKNEKDFVWMKGNRFSTVETVWNFYLQSAAIENFVLLLGHEKVDFEDTVEELDCFGDKKVIFRAVKESHPDAKGRELTAGVIKMDEGKGKGKKKVLSEVIVLGDED